MKAFFPILLFVLGFILSCKGQTSANRASPDPAWTEADRKYLLDNLIRSKEEILKETKGLTKKQWNFKESPDRWSINQIVEHIAIWELLLTHEISVALQRAPIPDFPHYLPDSIFLNQDPEALKKKNALDYTKPFSFAVPRGNNEGKNNVNWFITMRNESIDYLKKETRNIRLHTICFGPSVHQNYMVIFNHTDRHLRQIRKVKGHPDYRK